MAKSLKQKEHLERLNSNQKGENNRHWNGGETKTQNGYVYLLNREHPRSGRFGYVFQHIVVMEAHIGRFLVKGEVVHHKNGIRHDNRLENLALMTRKEHQSMHKSEYWLKKKLAVK